MLSSVVRFGKYGRGCCDTGADVSLITSRALKDSHVSIIKEHDINVQLSFIDGSSARATKELLCEITDYDGNVRRDWFILQEMDDVDILFGLTFMDGRNTEFNTAVETITSWDWAGRPFRFKMLNSNKKNQPKRLRMLGKDPVNCDLKNFRRVLRVRVGHQLDVYPNCA